MTTTTGTAEFRQNLGHYFDEVQREPVAIESRGRRRAVLVSPVFFDQALKALEDKLDAAKARQARQEADEIPFDQLMDELGIKLS